MAEPKRPLWTVVALLVVAALALWISSLLVWSWDLGVTGGAVALRPVRGAEFQPALGGLALAVLAAVGAVLATGGWLRRAVGVLMIAGGLGALWLAARGLAAPRPMDGAFERWRDDFDRWSVEAVFGMGLAAIASVLLLAAAALLLVSGHRMPRMGSRYQTPTARRAARAPDRALWDDLDAGRDPTA